MRRFRFLAAAVAAAAAALALAVPAAASGHGAIARDHAKTACQSADDWIIGTANGNHLRVGGDDSAGSPVVQRDNVVGNGVATCWHRQGTVNGHEFGYWSADNNGNRIGFGPNCSTGANWLNTTDGTVMIWIVKSGGFDLQSRLCGGLLSSDNTAGHQWTDRIPGKNGFYQLLGLHAPGT